MPTNRDTRQADYVCLLRIATRRMRSSERWSNRGVRVIFGGSLAGKVCSSCWFNSSSSSCFLRCARVSLSWSSGKSPFSRRHFGSVWCARRIKGSWAPSDAAESGNLSPSSQDWRSLKNLGQFFVPNHLLAGAEPAPIALSGPFRSGPSRCNPLAIGVFTGRWFPTFGETETATSCVERV